jgi:hypothetical protein
MDIHAPFFLNAGVEPLHATSGTPTLLASR